MESDTNQVAAETGCPMAGEASQNATSGAPESTGPSASVDAAGQVVGAAAPEEARRSRGACPGPKSSWMGWRGNALRFFGNPVDYMMRLREDHGEVAALTDGTNQPLFSRGDSSVSTKAGSVPRTVFGFGAEANREILTQLDVYQTRPPRGPNSSDFEELANNVLFANGTDHERRRKLMLPIFTRNSLQAYHPHMADLTRKLMSSWQVGQRLELDSQMSLVSLNIASKCLYGLEPETEKVGLAAQMRSMVRLMFSPAVLLPLKVPGTPYHRLIRDLRDVRLGLQAEVERLQASGDFGDDVLSIMVQRHLEEMNRVDIDEIVGEAFVMFFAGHDTTSKGLCWTLYLLAQHPDVAQRLCEELEEEVEGDCPTYQQLFTLSYLDRVVKESLRILSPAIMFPRFAVQDTSLCGFEIPAGTEIVYSSYVTHLDESIYPNPHSFDPDRWVDFKPTPYQYLPFGAGRRTCLGMTLGTLTIKLIVSMILKRFQLRVAEGNTVDLDTNVVMGPKPALLMDVHAVDSGFGYRPSRVNGYLSKMVDLPTT